MIVDDIDMLYHVVLNVYDLYPTVHHLLIVFFDTVHVSMYESMKYHR